MLLAFSGASTHKASLEQDIEAAATAGFRGLEISAGKLDRYLQDWWHADAAEQLREMLQKNRLQPVGVSSVDGFNFQGEHFDLVRRRSRTLAEQMKTLSCSTLVVVPGMAPQGTSEKEVRRETTQTLRELADEVAPYGVSLALKLLGFHWCSVRTLSDAWDIVREIDRPDVGLALDMAQLYLAEAKPDDLDRLDPAKIFLVYLNDVESVNRQMAGDVHRVMPGDGVIPLAEYLSHLESLGYDGVCSLEVFHPALWEKDPTDVARRGRGAMQRLLKPYFALE